MTGTSDGDAKSGARPGPARLPADGLRLRLTIAAAELSDQLDRSPRPSEVAEHAHADVDDVIESVASRGPIDQKDPRPQAADPGRC